MVQKGLPYEDCEQSKLPQLKKKKKIKSTKFEKMKT